MSRRVGRGLARRWRLGRCFSLCVRIGHCRSRRWRRWTSEIEVINGHVISLCSNTAPGRPKGQLINSRQVRAINSVVRSAPTIGHLAKKNSGRIGTTRLISAISDVTWGNDNIGGEIRS